MARRRTMAGESMPGLNEVWALIPESSQFNVRFWHAADIHWCHARLETKANLDVQVILSSMC